jgi:hypothetical protein
MHATARRPKVSQGSSDLTPSIYPDPVSLKPEPATPLPCRRRDSYLGNVIWLQSPPWARWIAALLIAAAAVWIEIRPAPTTLHAFAIEDIPAGTVIDHTNTETRPMPAGSLAPVELGQTALRPIHAGDPVLATDIGDLQELAPSNWWAIELSLPRSAQAGDSARLVLLDGSEVVNGVVITPAGEDPLGSGLGMIAVPPETAGEVARAVAEGRAAVMIASR